MALAEIVHASAPHPIAQEVPPEVQISQICPQDIKDIASKYWNNKRLLEGIDPKKMTGIETEVLGHLEVQGEFLTMLGQKHLLDSSNKINPMLAQIEQITTQGLKSMIEEYKNLKELYETRDLERLIWTTLLATPDEVRLEGRMDELDFLLYRLGQGRIVKKIREEAERNKVELPLAA